MTNKSSKQDSYFANLKTIIDIGSTIGNGVVISFWRSLSMDNLLSIDLAAIRAGVSISTIQRYVTLGKLSVAKRSPRRQLYFDPLMIDEWRIWYAGHLEKVKKNKQRRFSALAKVNGMMVPGQLPCEEQDESDRDRLFALARGVDKKAAKAALVELRQKYTLRLPLEEQRLGIRFEQEKIAC